MSVAWYWPDWGANPPEDASKRTDIVVRVVMDEDRVHISRSTGALQFTLAEWRAVQAEVQTQIQEDS